MAAKSIVLKNTLVLECKVGVDKNNKEIIKKQRFNNLRTILEDEKALALGGTIGALLLAPIAGVMVEENSQIINE